MEITEHRDVRKRGNGTGKVLVVLSAAFLLSLALAAVPAWAAVINTPPRLPHEVVIFPERDFVVAEGYEVGADLRIAVKRGGEVVSSATGRTDASGLLEVNHPGGVCWTDLTPDIQPEDRVEVTYRNTANNRGKGLTAGNGDASRTVNVTAEQAEVSGDTVVVHGTAQDADGNPINISLLEQRIIQPDFLDRDANPDSRIGRRDIRADSSGGRVQGDDGADLGDGDLVYDPVGPDNPDGVEWTATYTGLNDAERQLAVEGQTRVLSWLRANAAGDRLGITIFEVGEVGGPGFGGCPPGPGPVIDPAAPDAPILYDADADSYDSSGLIGAEGAATDSPILEQLHEVVVFPERDFVVAEGYEPGVKLEFVVRRPGVGVVGSARGVAGRDGIVEVNHPGGSCWTGQTPNIKPGDVVDVVRYHEETLDNGTTGDPSDDTVIGVADGGETQRTINVRVTRAAFVNAAGNLQVKGTARNPDGSRVSLGLLEQRIINPDFNGTRIGRRDIRADSSGGRVENIPGGRGALRYDSAGSTNWTATYTGLNNTEKRLAVEGQTRVLSWLAANAAGDRFGITIFEAGEVGGPGFGGCPPQGQTDLSLPIN